MSERDALDSIAKRFSSKGDLKDKQSSVTDPGGWSINAKMTDLSFRTMKEHFHGNSCLELASSDGQMTRQLLDLFERVVAIDGSSIQIERLNSSIQSDKLKTHVALIEEFETDEKFDVVVMSYVLEHVEDPVFCLSHAASFLAPGGTLLVTVPSATSLHRRVALEIGYIDSLHEFSDADVFSGHRRVYDSESLKYDIDKSGLTTNGIDGILLKPLTQAQMENWFSDELIEGFYQVGKEYPELCSSICASICQ